MKLPIVTLLVISILALGLAFNPVTSLAQEATATPTPTVSPTVMPGSEATIFSKPSLNPEIEQVRQSYRGQLQTYRDDERAFLIAQGQFQNLGTLVSLETAVQATRTVMHSRNLVLKSYLTLLRLNLIEATGINLDQKQQALSAIEKSIADLDQHYQQVTAAQDRLAVNQASDAFNQISPGLQVAAYQAQDLLTIGRLQSIYDKAVSLDNDMEQNLATASSPVKQAERTRAFQETQRAIDQVKSNLDEVVMLSQNGEPNDSRHGQIAEKLSPVHSGLSRVVNFLGELLAL